EVAAGTVATATHWSGTQRWSSGMAKKANKKASKRAKKTRRTATARRKHGTRKWSQRVTERSNALDLEPGVFKKRSARQVAASLKRSAERSRRRKADAYRSALSMLSFY